jgi:hypothetical protein
MDSLVAELEKLRLSYPVVFVDNEEELAKAVKEVPSHKTVVFDTENVAVGRSGPLTVTTLTRHLP